MEIPPSNAKYVFVSRWNKAISCTMPTKWSFPLKISLVNVTKFAVYCGLGQIYWKSS